MSNEGGGGSEKCPKIVTNYLNGALLLVFLSTSNIVIRKKKSNSIWPIICVKHFFLSLFSCELIQIFFSQQNWVWIKRQIRNSYSLIWDATRIQQLNTVILYSCKENVIHLHWLESYKMFWTYVTCLSLLHY